MSRLALVSFSILLFGTAAFLLSLNGCGGGSSSTANLTIPPPNSKIQHVVIIFQENRSTDNLFQGLCISPYGNPSSCNSTNPTASQYDIANSGLNSSQQTVPLTQIDLGTAGFGTNPDNYDLSHAHSAFVEMCDLNGSGACAMDGANLITVICNTGVTGCPPANPQYMYVNPADVQPYLTMAEQYTFADHMFQTNQGPSFPAHQFIISGTSAPTATSNAFASENPAPGIGNEGCNASPNETVKVIDPTGNEANPLYPPIYPCFEHPTLTDLLDTASITWRYYAPSAGSIWTAPNAIQHMCGPNNPPPNGTVCAGSDFTATEPKVVLGQTQSNAQILSDIASNQLQQVSWVIPDGQDSDHARLNNGCGPSWVTSIVNAIGNSSYWSNTVIILTWDDWGGWYDHVPPPQVLAGANCTQWGCGYVYGFRVPMIVMSPYTKPAYISHVNHDFGSILKFIETNFNLPSLGYADVPADDLSDFFNMAQTPNVFQTIAGPPAPLDAATCASDTSPATDPDDD
jgi:phospholipase C